MQTVQQLQLMAKSDEHCGATSSQKVAAKAGYVYARYLHVIVIDKQSLTNNFRPESEKAKRMTDTNAR